MKTKADFETALKAANEATFVPARASGCGRAYLGFYDLSKPEKKALKAAAETLGLMFLKEAYGTSGNVLYVGYDNADGKALAKAEVMVKVLGEHGIKSYVDPVSD